MEILPFGDIDLVRAILATILCMAIGFFWYSPGVFGAEWMKLTGIKPENSSKEEMKKSMILGLVATFIGSYSIGLLIALLDPNSLKEGFTYGILFWVAFVLVNELHGIAWEKRPQKLMGINASNSLLVILVTIFVFMV